ncbi:MAG: primosomal replication protein N [Burkholderiales bacterium]|nr:primosomal replication protein N [Burkholderiales bacterium]
MSINEIALSGVAHDLLDLRFTPAGIPVIEFSLRHRSVQAEAGHSRQVELDLPAIAFGALARRLAEDAPKTPIMARGFLARRSLRSTRVVLHARDIEYQ